MSEHIEKTLVLLKPDAVERALAGKIITRIEDAGFKIVGMKMVAADAEMTKKHYSDVAERHGERIFQQNVDFITSGPVVAIVVEGVKAIENIRKLAGTTEPKASPPGTIRGDYSHMSYGYADENNFVAKNVIHASSDTSDAEREIKLWFKPEEIIEYSNVHERHTR
jgi:nucleoside-diphosphate kinase